MHHLYWIAAFNSLAFANSFKLTAYGRMVVTRVSSRKLAVPPATLLLASNQKAPTGERENPSLSPRSKQKSVPIPVTPSPQKKRKSPSPASLEGSVLTSFDVAAVNPTQPYIDLCVSPEELRPSATLTTGQCFHWKVVKNKEDDEEHQSAWGAHNATEWVGTIRSPTSSIVVAIRETPTTTLYRPLTSCSCDLRELLCNYFQLQYPLNELYKEWSKADGRMAEIARCIPGVRIIDQDPWECLISFICSSNNNIPRITKILSSIRKHYGTALCTIGDQIFYSFPSCEELAANATDEDFRNICGLGYRSKYILETIRILQSYGGETYLQELREINDCDLVQEKLCEFCGVGRKVADCVALFSLQQDSAIPVDVHVWNIARRDYDPDGSLKVKSLTPAVYKQVGDSFRVRFRMRPGWAHSLLFVAELPSFKPALPEKIIRQMEEFKKLEQLRKQEAKASQKRSKA